MEILAIYQSNHYEIEGFEKVKKDLKDSIEKYKQLVVTEDEISKAKKDRAQLNRAAKMINDRKIQVKQIAFAQFENQCKELIGLIKEAMDSIDNQVEVYNQKEIDEKKETINKLWASFGNTEISLEKIFNEKWLNKTYSLSNIQSDMESAIDDYNKSIEIIKQLATNAFEQELLKQHYNETLDLNYAMNQLNNYRNIVNKTSAEDDENVEEGIPFDDGDEQLYTISFEVTSTKEKLQILSKFLRNNNFKFKQIIDRKEN